MFDYVEMFYNRKRKHIHTNMLPPAEFERQYFLAESCQGNWGRFTVKNKRF